MIRAISALKSFIDTQACDGTREPDRITTRSFTDGRTVRNAVAQRNAEGGYDVQVFEGKASPLLQRVRKTETLRADAGLVRAVILLDEWAQAQRAQPGQREDMTPCFGGGALVDHVAKAKGLRHYLRRDGQ